MGLRAFYLFLSMFGFSSSWFLISPPIAFLGDFPVFVHFLVRRCVFPSPLLFGTCRFLSPWFVSRLLCWAVLIVAQFPECGSVSGMPFPHPFRLIDFSAALVGVLVELLM